MRHWSDPLDPDPRSFRRALLVWVGLIAVIVVVVVVVELGRR